VSKHHQASRRRSYRRRQHELHERVDREERRPESLPEPHEDSLAPNEARVGFVRWQLPAWAGLR
jgi:hypothetical protein